MDSTRLGFLKGLGASLALPILPVLSNKPIQDKKCYKFVECLFDQPKTRTQLTTREDVVEKAALEIKRINALPPQGRSGYTLILFDYSSSATWIIYDSSGTMAREVRKNPSNKIIDEIMTKVEELA